MIFKFLNCTIIVSSTYVLNRCIPLLNFRFISWLLERRIQQVNRFDAFGFELDFVELRRHNISLAVAPENLHGVGCERNISRIARFQRTFKNDNGMGEILITLAIDDVILRVVFEDVFKVRVLPMTILKSD